MRILIVEDDESLGLGIKKALSRDGSTVEWLTEGEQAIDAILAEEFELVILDLGLPGKNGIDVLNTVRSRGNSTPVLILTARGSLDDRVTGLDAGADDYLTKPFELEELKARIRALSRRSHGQADTILSIGDITLNTSSMVVTLSGKAVDLNRHEYALLLEFINNLGRVLTRNRLETLLYGWDGDTDSNAMEVHIHHLRKKLPNAKIKTVRGIGYRMDSND